MNKSEDVTKLIAALIEAQKEFPPIIKSADNPFFHSKYADLDAITTAIKPVLLNHGLTLTCLFDNPDRPGKQVTTEWNGKDKNDNPIKEITITTCPPMTMTAILLHTSGQFMSSTISLTPADGDPQGMGAASTYARRFLIQSLAWVVGEPDDDGNYASGRQRQDDQPPPKKSAKASTYPKKTPAKPAPVKPPTQQDVDEGAERFGKEVLDEGNDTFSKPLEKPAADADMARYKARCNAGIEALTLLMGKSPAAILAAMKLKNPATGKAVFVGKLDEVQTLEGLRTVFDKMCVMLEENEIKPAELWHQKGI